MASVDKRPDGQWRARWREYPGGPQKSQHFGRKVDAERHIVKMQHDLLTGTYIDPGKARTTVRDFYDVWRQRQPWRPTTRMTTEGLLGGHFLPVFGARPIGSVRRGDLEAWVNGLPLAKSTARLAMQHVSGLFTAAVADGLIPNNPAVGVKRPRVDSAPVKPFTSAEIEKLSASAPGWFAVAVTLGAGCGLRQGEATGLTVDRVDFLRRELTIDRQSMPLATAGALVHVPPKTARSYRTVPLARTVVDSLARHLEEFGAGREGVVLHRNGSPILRAQFGKQWRATREAAELPTARFHDTRHYFASILLSGGVSVAAAAEYLGHSPAMLLSVYAHLIPADHERARAVVDAAFTAAEGRESAAEG